MKLIYLKTKYFRLNLSALLKQKSIHKNIVNSFYYFGGSFIQFLIAIFTQPIYSKYLDLEDFAVIGYFTAIQAVLLPLFHMSMPFYYLANYWTKEGKGNSQENLSFILNFLNIINLIFAFGSFLIVQLYFKSFHVSFPLMPFIFIVLIILYFEKYRAYYLIECRVQKNGMKFFLISLLQILTNTCFSIYFVVSINGKAVGRMSGIMLGVVITGIIALFLLIQGKNYRFSYKIDMFKAKEVIKYCTPLILGAYAYYPIGNIDRVFLERLANVKEYGYYSIGLTLSGFVGTFFNALYQSFEPDLYKFVSEKKKKEYLVFAAFFISLLVILSILFITFSNPVVSFLTNGRYTYASTYANIFVIGVMFMQVGGLFEQLLTAYGATKYVMLRNVLTGIFCVLLYYVLVKKYQFMGANIARVISSIFFMIIGATIFAFYNKFGNKKAAKL